MTSRILIGCMLSDKRSDCVAGRKYERVSRGVFHYQEIPEIPFGM